MGVEDEVQRMRSERQQQLDHMKEETRRRGEEALLPPTQRVEAVLRRTGVLADLESLRQMTGDSKARIEIDAEGATLIWDQEPEAKPRFDRVRERVVSKDTHRYKDPVDSKTGWQTEHKVTETVSSVTYEERQRVEAKTVHVESKEAVALAREELARKLADSFVFTESMGSIRSFDVKTGKVEERTEKSVYDDKESHPVTKKAREQNKEIWGPQNSY